MILALMKAVYVIAYIEACKKSGLQRGFNVWPMTMVLCSNQPSYEATGVGSWSFVGHKEPVRNECEVKYEIFQILNCGHEIKEAMILPGMKAIYAIAYIEACKKSGL